MKPTKKCIASAVKACCIILVDLVCVFLSYYLISAIETYFTPFKRGFFCGDTTIAYPEKKDTISDNMIKYTMIFIPCIVIGTCEGLRSRSDPRTNFYGVPLPAMFVNIHKHVLIYFFGGCSDYVVVDVVKYSVGRLRPFFLEACRPSYDCMKENEGTYIDYSQYSCVNVLDWKKNNEIRMSFPSGHSALASFSAFYLICYSERKFDLAISFLFKRIFQIFCLSFAFYTGLSRINDNRHHYQDVIGGSIIGGVGGVLVSVFVAGVFVEKSYRKQRSTTESKKEDDKENHSEPSN